jgi:hypothetical protein
MPPPSDGEKLDALRDQVVHDGFDKLEREIRGVRDRLHQLANNMNAVSLRLAVFETESKTKTTMLVAIGTTIGTLATLLITWLKK